MMSRSVKLVRTEYGLNQDKMAHCLGISKKTLVEIEKERTLIGWTGAAALAVIFSDSTVLQNSFGGEMSDLVKALAFDETSINFRQTAGDRCVYSSFSLERVRQAAADYEKLITDTSNGGI